MDVDKKECKINEMYSEVVHIRNNQDDYINDKANELISDEKIKLQSDYEKKQTALLSSMKSEKRKLEIKYKEFSTDLKDKYNLLSATNNAILFNMSVCILIISLLSIVMNDHFIDAIHDVLSGITEYEDNYEKFAGSIFFVVVLIILVFWTVKKFGDSYTLYILTTTLSLMIFSSGFCYEHNINFILIGIILYVIYGIFRSVRLIEDYEQRMQLSSFFILLAISIALVFLFFKSMSSSFANL